MSSTLLTPPAAPPAPQRRRLVKHAPGLLRGAAGVLIFLILAEIVTRLGIVDEQYLPHASTVLERAVRMLGTAEFVQAIGWTLLGWALALLLASVIGVVAGAAFASSRVTAAMAGVVISVLRPLPAVALVPLASLVWGQGLSMKLILVSFSAVWPIFFNTLSGVREVDPVAVDTARGFGLNRWAILRRITLPAAAPQVFTGIRVAASIALVVIVGIEVIAGASDGIGAYILKASSTGTDMPSVMAGAVVAGVLGLLVNQLFIALDRRWFGWARREVTS